MPLYTCRSPRRHWRDSCWSQGATEEEALRNIQDAIAEYLTAVDELLKNEDVREVSVVI